MDRLFVCLWTAVRRFVRVWGCQTDGVRAKLRTDNHDHDRNDHVNHNHGSDNDNHNRNVAGPHKI